MKPILFSTPMVQAILDGRKTMTRRAVREDKHGEWAAVNDCRKHECGAGIPCYLSREVSVDDKSRNVIYPRYDIGDILYVRETWARHSDYATAETMDNAKDGYIYRAIGEYRMGMRWRPSIHMPKEAARIFLRVTDVRVERLQEITEEDAIAEGCEGIRCACSNKECGGGMVVCTDCMGTGWLEPPTREFMFLFDILNNKSDYDWNANPWVWVIAFERCEKPITDR